MGQSPKQQSPGIVEDPAPFDAEEADTMAALDAAFEADTLPRASEARLADHVAAARATLNPPRKAVSVRFPAEDLRKLKVRALEEGVPYQTLLTSIVHRFVEGRLVEK